MKSIGILLLVGGVTVIAMMHIRPGGSGWIANDFGVGNDTGSSGSPGSPTNPQTYLQNGTILASMNTPGPSRNTANGVTGVLV